MPLKLVIFDVDGTLVDSQGDIVAAMTAAHDAVGLAPPVRKRILAIVGLSLPDAMAELAPDTEVATRQLMVTAYKDKYMDLRMAKGSLESSPLYPSVRDVLQDLHARDEVLLGVATGKSRRGLDKLLEGHDLKHFFVTQQVSDHHPSKPHPAMVHAALAETGIAPQDAVMVGDTSFDMQMAAAAGVPGIGVSWGYHPRSRLTEATTILDDIRELPAQLAQIWD